MAISGPIELLRRERRFGRSCCESQQAVATVRSSRTLVGALGEKHGSSGSRLARQWAIGSILNS